MPTLIREGGFEIRIYTLDHPPPHVHVAKAGAVMKIELATCEVVKSLGPSPIVTFARRNFWSRSTRSFCARNGRRFMASQEPTAAIVIVSRRPSTWQARARTRLRSLTQATIAPDAVLLCSAAVAR